VILNISSIAGFRPLTKSVAYCAGKAALNNFTQWLAVHMASHYSPDIRVNALAPGFVLSEQNRFLMLDSATGELTERGRLVLRHVPLARLGTADDMTGAALWLVSEKAKFVTGAVIPVDGGFTAQAGV
jgi:NAD(P)-dependent dehydrogenase (short-subunit alcohol dehydrogenase family)